MTRCPETPDVRKQLRSRVLVAETGVESAGSAAWPVAGELEPRPLPPAATAGRPACCGGCCKCSVEGLLAAS